MKPFGSIVLALAVATLGCTSSAKAPAPPAGQPAAPAVAPVSMDSMISVNGCLMTPAGGLVLLSSPLPDRALVQTPAKFRPPFSVRLRAATDSTNLRVYYNAGMVILNWEVRQDEFRAHDPLTSQPYAVRGKGWIKPGELHTIVWEVRPDGMSLSVDGETRFSAPGDYANINAPIGIGPAFGSVVSVESFEVTTP